MANPTGRGGFSKGKSGNPGGRPRSLASVMYEARRHTRPALATLVKLMKTAKSESVKLGAAEAILSRGWGKPIQALQVDGRFLTKKLSDMTPEEIQALEERIEMIEDNHQTDMFAAIEYKAPPEPPE
jgi:Family of unknown function (DUF5681)